LLLKPQAFDADIDVARRGRQRAMSRSIRFYTTGVGALCCVLLGMSALHGLPPLPLGRLVALLAIAILGEEIVVLQRERVGSPAFSFSAPAHIAAAILLGPLGAAFVAGSGVIVADGLRRSSRKFLVLNASMFAISTWLAAEVYRAAGGGAEQGIVSLSALPAIASLIAARYLVTVLVLWGGHVLATAKPSTFILRETLTEELEPAVGEGALGVLLAISLVPGHATMLVLLAPLLVAVYRSKSIFERLKQETRAALDAVATVIDQRHPSTAAHSTRVAELVGRFVEAVGLPDRESERLLMAARFHDIGKVAVDASTLSKAERLSDEELAAIRRHPHVSARLLSPFQFAREIARYVEYHHERYDGRGYYSITRDELPIESHLLIVADSFDAMTSPRPYRPALTLEEALDELHDKSGSQFHPLVAKAFAAVVRGDRLEAALSGVELRTLRQEFRDDAGQRLRRVRVVPQPRLVTIGLALLSFWLLAVRSLPWPATALIVSAAVLSAVFWLHESVSVSRRSRCAKLALDAGASVDEALRASGIATWFAWLDEGADGIGYQSQEVIGTIGTHELAECCSSANRNPDLVHDTLSSGRRLLLSPAVEGHPRLAIALDRRSAALAELCEEICASLTAAAEPQPSRLRLVSAAPAPDDADLVLMIIELGAFERVRVAAGQLLAQRIVVEAERRLRGLLREDDEIVKTGDDCFTVSLRLRNPEQRETVTRRITRELAAIKLPHRVEPLEPLIRVTAAEPPAEATP
jgi:hypothetical protein